jgi:hypothetical protein
MMSRFLAAVGLIASLTGGLSLLAARVEPAPLRRGDFFGMVTHYWGDVMPDRMRELGANWARVNCAWADVQPTPDPDPSTWDWGCPDQAMAATEQGFYVLYGLGYAPSWANGGRGDNYPPSPSHLGDWYHYCAELMRRYRGRYVVYEVWNEPNLDIFFMGSFDDYANLVRYASQAMRAIDPTARLSGPETSSLNTPGRESWHRDAVSQLAGMFDIVTTHWYCGSRCGPGADGVAEQVAAYIGTRSADLPQGVPLWLTETGVATTDDARQAEFYDGVLKAYDGNFRNAGRRRPAWQNLFFYHLLAPDDATIVRLNLVRTRRQAYYRYQYWILGRPYAVPRTATVR